MLHSQARLAFLLLQIVLGACFGTAEHGEETSAERMAGFDPQGDDQVVSCGMGRAISQGSVDASLSGVLSTDHFDVFYATHGTDAVRWSWMDLRPRDGHPDFVNEVAQGAEGAYEVFVHGLGYEPPRERVRIELKSLDGYLGWEEHGVVSIDNDALPFVSPTILRATVAHEFFHVLQEHLIPGLATEWRRRDDWFIEASAVWAEDVATNLFEGWPVGQLLRDALLVQRLRNGLAESLLSTSASSVIPFELVVPLVGPIKLDYPSSYSTFLWVQFLVERTGNESIVRRVFEIMGSADVRADSAVDAALREQGTTFEDEFREYTVWNYLVGSRDDGRHYQEGSSFFAGLGSSAVSATHRELPAEFVDGPAPLPDLWSVNVFEFEVDTAAQIVLEVQANEHLNWRLTTLAHDRAQNSWTTVHHEPQPGALRSVTVDRAERLDRVVLLVQHIGTVPGFGHLNPQRLVFRYRASEGESP